MTVPGTMEPLTAGKRTLPPASLRISLVASKMRKPAVRDSVAACLLANSRANASTAVKRGTLLALCCFQSTNIQPGTARLSAPTRRSSAPSLALAALAVKRATALLNAHRRDLTSAAPVVAKVIRRLTAKLLAMISGAWLPI